MTKTTQLVPNFIKLNRSVGHIEGIWGITEARSAEGIGYHIKKICTDN